MAIGVLNHRFIGPLDHSLEQPVIAKAMDLAILSASFRTRLLRQILLHAVAYIISSRLFKVMVRQGQSKSDVQKRPKIGSKSKHIGCFKL